MKNPTGWCSTSIPDEGISFDTVKGAAEHIRDRIAEMGMVTFPMVTGGKGIHIIAPLTPRAEWPEVKDFAQRFARAAEQLQPDRFTSVLSKEKRKGRIFIDYLRNQRGATAVMPYSARARENAPVAVPVTWEQLRKLEGANSWHIRDGASLLKRAGVARTCRLGRGRTGAARVLMPPVPCALAGRRVRLQTGT